MTLSTGLRGDSKLVVDPGDTARALGTAEIDVLATPRLVALCEEAAQSAVDGELPDGATTIGMRVRLDHLQPSPVGAEVVAEAVLEKINGRRLEFTCSVSDAGGLVAAGRITRVVVDVERFMGKCC